MENMKRLENPELTLNEFYDFLCGVYNDFRYVIYFNGDTFLVMGYYWGEHICESEKLIYKFTFGKGMIKKQDVLDELKIILRYKKILKLIKKTDS